MTVASSTTATDTNAALSSYTNPLNTLTSSTGVVVATNDTNSATPTAVSSQPSAGSTLPFDEEAKLVYGVVLSLRNMIKKLSGR